MKNQWSISLLALAIIFVSVNQTIAQRSVKVVEKTVVKKEPSPKSVKVVEKTVVRKNHPVQTVQVVERTVVQKSASPRAVNVVARSIPALPRNSVVVHHGKLDYYFSNGLFYQPYRGGYVVVSPPIGIRIPALPLGYAKTRIHNQIFYRYQDVYYKPILLANGSQIYEVVPA
ncbi:DUF6515 family protein [Membranihabitans marinus]|uniref:DUF6515 family protein n=1 Tax=Membranihabitans marinus TaxID=1227546 RepID=UPI001F2C6EF5|nr:DUF6515 family protein [Membranihabitans marinus]